MQKPNIKFLYSTAKLQGSRALRSVSPGFEDMRLRASYDNVNLKNHLPFADKSVRDVLRPDERFKTFYAQESTAALRQNASALIGNLDQNNSLNKGYKKRLLDENHKLGLQNKVQERDNFKTVEQNRQDEATNPNSQFTASRLIDSGKYPA